MSEMLSDIKRTFEKDVTIKRSKIQVILDPAELSGLTRPKTNWMALALFAVLALCGAFSLFMFGLQQRSTKSIAELKSRVSTLTSLKHRVDTSLKRSLRLRRVYGASLQEESDRSHALSIQIARLMSSEVAHKSRAHEYEASLSNATNENEALKDQLDRALQEKNAAGEQITYLQGLEEGLRNKIKRLLTKSDVDLGAIMVNPTSLQGTILRANSQYNFIIIDLGKNDGVRVGTAFIASRGGRQLGSISIEKVYDELSVGKADFAWNADEIGPNDTVRGKE